MREYFELKDLWAVPVAGVGAYPMYWWITHSIISYLLVMTALVFILPFVVLFVPREDDVPEGPDPLAEEIARWAKSGD